MSAPEGVAPAAGGRGAVEGGGAGNVAVAVTPELLRGWPLTAAGGDKDATGRVLIAAGSAATPGALLLAAHGCLRAGAGKLQLATVESRAAAISVAMPEALVAGVAEAPSGDLDPGAAGELSGLASGCTAVLLGPGVLNPATCVSLLAGVLSALADTECSVLLDAGALSVVSSAPELLTSVAGRCLLSPNRKELALALGEDPDEVADDPAAAALRLAFVSGAVVSAGGATSYVAHPDGRLWRVDAGGPGLGVSGSGDVQAGIMVGLLARGAEPAQAALWGAYLHGRAGELLAVDVGGDDQAVGFLAREIPAYVPKVLSELG